MRPMNKGPGLEPHALCLPGQGAPLAAGQRLAAVLSLRGWGSRREERATSQWSQAPSSWRQRSAFKAIAPSQALPHFASFKLKHRGRSGLQRSRWLSWELKLQMYNVPCSSHLPPVWNEKGMVMDCALQVTFCEEEGSSEGGEERAWIRKVEGGSG